MRVEEQGAAFGKSSQVGRLRLRMTVHASDPIVQIVDGKKEDIRLLGGNNAMRCSDEGDYDSNESHGYFVGPEKLL